MDFARQTRSAVKQAEPDMTVPSWEGCTGYSMRPNVYPEVNNEVRASTGNEYEKMEVQMHLAG